MGFPQRVLRIQVVNSGKIFFHTVFRRPHNPGFDEGPRCQPFFHRFHTPYYYDYPSLCFNGQQSGAAPSFHKQPAQRLWPDNQCKDEVNRT